MKYIWSKWINIDTLLVIMECLGTTTTRGEKEPLPSDALISLTQQHCSAYYAIICMVLLKDEGNNFIFHLWFGIINIFTIFCNTLILKI